jgi:hypothetical protein
MGKLTGQSWISTNMLSCYENDRRTIMRRGDMLCGVGQGVPTRRIKVRRLPIKG